MSRYAIIDFETTGLSPDMGDRATEIAAVMISDGEIVDRYQSLINPGRPIPSFVQSLTGISDNMVRNAPDASTVMRELFQKVGHLPLVAHNASFDRRFLDFEYRRAGLQRRTDFACSMLVARRLYPSFATHKLGDLVSLLHLPSSGVYHRAMADAEMTAYLMRRMESDLRLRHGLSSVGHVLFRQIEKVPKHQFESFIARSRA